MSLCIHFTLKLVEKSRLKNERRLVRDQSGLGGAVVQDLQHQFRVDAGLRGQHHALVERLQDVGKDQILGEFRVQPHARPAAVVQALAHGLEVAARTRSKTSLSPPIMNVSVPPSAPGFDPVHGASRKWKPLFASFEPIARLDDGETVLASTTTAPAFAPCAIPFSPRMRFSDIALSPTQRNTHSASARRLCRGRAESAARRLG